MVHARMTTTSLRHVHDPLLTSPVYRWHAGERGHGGMLSGSTSRPRRAVSARLRGRQGKRVFRPELFDCPVASSRGRIVPVGAVVGGERQEGLDEEEGRAFGIFQAAHVRMTDK